MNGLLAPPDAEGPDDPAPSDVTEGFGQVTAPDGSHWVSAVAKRTYAFSTASRKITLAGAQDPLVAGPRYELHEDDTSELLDDTDLCATKPATDVVVRGSVRLGRPTRRARAGIAVGRSRRVVELLGPRTVHVDFRGRVHFTDPELFDDLELGARQAYGGFDAFARLVMDPGSRRLDRAPEAAWPFAYPRNPAGRGYLVDMERRRADGLPLPRLEDPDEPLGPASFFVRRPDAWMKSPLPGLLSWVSHAAYPRAARYLGPVAQGCEARPVRPPREALFPDGADLQDLAPDPKRQALPRCLQGAPPGLAVERLRGDELVVLEGLVAEAPRLEFHLPGEAPSFELLVPTVGRLTLDRALQTLRIDLDRRTASLTWSGAFRLATEAPPEFLESCAMRVSWGAA